MLVPAAIAFAYDGVLIGAGDYRFLGSPPSPTSCRCCRSAPSLVATDAGIGAIWAAVGVWMVLRAVCNHLRARHVLRPPVAVPGAWREPAPRHRRHRVPRRASSPRSAGVTDGTSPPSARRDLDVRDAGAVAAFVGRLRPDAIVHTAYVRDGPTARAVNVDGSDGGRRGRRRGARLVHVSTDVVFDGRLGRPYREDDAVSPITDYGRTKADAEQAVLRRAPGAVVVRTSLIYGGPGRPPSPHEVAAADPDGDVLHRRAALPGPGRRPRRGARRAVPPRRRRHPPRRRAEGRLAARRSPS